MTRRPVLTAQWYVALTLCMMAFTLYGSFVPFNYTGRSWDEAVSAFRWLLETRIRIESRSDWLANWMLGVPLGFFALGMLRVDRKGILTSIFWASVVLPLCGLFSVVVEFAQLYFPGRTCSASDIVAQTVGSVIGVVLWLVLGQGITNSIRRVWDDPRSGGTIGRVFVAYVVVVALVQLLPLDIATSPKEIYKRARDGASYGRYTLKPFQEWQGIPALPPVKHLRLIQTWLELVGLYMPAGLLLSRLPGWIGRSWFSAPVVVALGLVIATTLEAAQLLVSRHPSTTDAVFGAVGVTIGWLAGRLATRPDKQGISIELAVVFGQIWVAVLAYTHWQDFRFAAPHWNTIVWIPFADLQSKNYIGALDDVLERILMFVPIGVLVTAVGRPSTGWIRPLFAAAAGLGIACVLEIGQVYLPDRFPTTTDLLTATLGSFVSSVVVQQLRPLNEEQI